ncbi:MAG: hypothetical protein E7597_03550 [Ruminococcaceae bacterium]|nr:hypothetical protein [Oscillospiraceae bacterium]
MNKKSLILAISLVLVMTCTIGVTVAYLQDTTDPVTNVFVAADFADLTLEETKPAEYDSNEATNDYLVVPGMGIAKDPKVSFAPEADEDNLVGAYVFVKMDAAGWTTTDNKAFTKGIGNCADALSFSVETYWTFLKMEGDSYIYYKAVAADETINAQKIIANDKVTVSTAITEADLDGVSENLSVITDSSLIFSAYAIQQLGFDSTEAAWTAVYGQSQD